MLEGFIASLLAISLIIKSIGHSSGLVDMPDMFSVHQQLGWIAVFILLISCHLCNIEYKLNFINKYIKANFQEPEEKTDNEFIKNYKYILFCIVIFVSIGLIAYFLIKNS